MDMKKNILLSMILLALCLIQASAANYYYKINYYNENGKLRGWTGYIEVREKKEVIDGNQKTVYVNGLRDLINGGTVTDEGHVGYTLPKTADNKVDLDKIYGIVFANEKGRNKGEGLNHTGGR